MVRIELYLPDNFNAFRRGRGITQCLAKCTGKIYQSFNNREFFIATFVDIRGVVPSIQSSFPYYSLISKPSIFRLFSPISYHFFSPIGNYFPSLLYSANVRFTTTDLPQSSCLSPILFNIYKSSVVKQLETLGHKCLVYADDIVTYIHNQNIDLATIATISLNNALEPLHNILSSSFFSIAPEKCKALIFTRRRFNNCPDIIINGHILPFVNNYKYLGLTLDAKLRWSPHLEELKNFSSHWSNFHRAVTNTWWGSYSTSLLLIYK